MKQKLLLQLCIVAFTISFITSCTKDTEMASRTATTCDCRALYGNERKIKTMKVTDNGTLRNAYIFKYKNGLVDSIYKTYENEKVTYNYKFFYPTNSCIPSGYRFGYGQYGEYGNYADGAFLTDGNYIDQKQVAQDYFGNTQTGGPGGDYGYYYVTSSSGLITSWRVSRPDFRNDGIVQFVKYRGKNVTSAYLLEDYTDNMGAAYNTNHNPFYNQDRLIFYASLNPYNLFNTSTFDHDGFNVLLNILLSPNSTTKVSYSDYDITANYNFDFSYVYNAQGYPTQITVKEGESYDGTTFNLIATEVLDITYY